jgi:hypothetical protein
MAKTIKRTFRTALRRRFGPKPVENINLGLLSGTACSWVLLLLGCASAEADEATAPPYSEQQATEQAAKPTSP